MIIIVNATATRSSGALTIYNQFISHLASHIGSDQYYLFVDRSMPQPHIEGVSYIQDNNHSWEHRIYWDYYGCEAWLKENDITPDVIVSLQNSGIITRRRQVVYYHQPLPFYRHKWSFFKGDERLMAMYKHIYPIIIAPTFSKQTDVVVQIPFIKKAFVERFKVDDKRVHILFPDTDDIDIISVQAASLDADYFHFLYPATYNPYKEHLTIVESLILLKKKYPNALKKVRVHFTLTEQEAPILLHRINEGEVFDNFIFHGRMPHCDLLSLYKAADALLFPSIIETLGLPLIEAARFGLPIIAADIEYAREVLEGYNGVQFIKAKSYEEWADYINISLMSKKRFTPLEKQASTWSDFFRLVRSGVIYSGGGYFLRNQLVNYNWRVAA